METKTLALFFGLTEFLVKLARVLHEESTRRRVFVHGLDFQYRKVQN